MLSYNDGMLSSIWNSWVFKLVADLRTEQQVNIKFLVKLKKTATKTFSFLCEV